MSKRIFLLIVMNCFCLLLIAQQFTLSGEVKGRDTGILVLRYYNRADTAILKSGKFSFSGHIEEPTPAYLTGNVKSISMDDPNFAFIFLEPKNMIGILTENDFSHLDISGSITQDEMEQYNKQLEPIRNKLEYLRNEQKILNAETTSLSLTGKSDSIETEKAFWDKQLVHTQYNFVASNPQSFLSPYLMSSYKNDGISVDSASILYEKFSSLVKNNFYGKRVYKDIQADKQTRDGNVAPDFTATDINGKKIALDSYKEKGFVLLDFWGSWCIPCRKLTPHLKKLYQEYHLKGFEIISISDDKSTVVWKNSVKKDRMEDWVNIQNNAEQNLTMKYSVTAYPTLILINKEGNIISRYVGFGADNPEFELDKKLKEKFDGK